MPLLGFDAVNVNTLSTAAMADPSRRFFFAKATEGMGWKAPDYANLRARAETAGKLFGAYHYAWPNQDPLAEAQNFLGYSALKPGEIAVFDIERQTDFPTSGLAADERAWWQRNIKFSVTWLTEVAKALGVKPVIYINRYWRTELLKYSTAEQRAFLTSHPLWLADPTGVGGQYGDIAEWPATFHQYIMGTGIDNNWFKYDEAKWFALAIPKPVVPKTLDDIFNEIAKMQTQFTATLSDLTNRVNALDTATTVNKNVLAAVQTQLNTVGTTVNSTSAKAYNIEIKMDNVAGRLEDGLAVLNDIALETEQNSVKADALRNDIMERFDSVQSDFDSVTSLMSELSTALGEVKAEVNQISEDAAKPKEIKLTLQDAS